MPLLVYKVYQITCPQSVNRKQQQVKKRLKGGPSLFGFVKITLQQNFLPLPFSSMAAHLIFIHAINMPTYYVVLR